MRMRVEPFLPSGEVYAIPSKSDALRKLILASLCESPTCVTGARWGGDVLSACDCLRALGANIAPEASALRVSPGRASGVPCLDAGESAAALRFLAPVAMARYARARFVGRGRLPERPIADLLSALGANGVCASAPRLPFSLCGRLRPGVFSVPGNVSSQYVTGLLLALPLLDGDSRIEVRGRLESAPYAGMTLEVMARFGLCARETDGGYFVPGRQTPASPGEICVEGDWSNAAFFLAAGARAPEGVRVRGLRADSPQGDRRVLDHLRAMGACARMENGVAEARMGEARGALIDLTDAPDLIAPLAAAAAFSREETVFTGLARLRLKESDRLAGVRDVVCALGGFARAENDCLRVRGGALAGGVAHAQNDHRLAMAAAVMAAGCEGPVDIRGAQAVYKSYPDFFAELSKIGGRFSAEGEGETPGTPFI